MHLIVIQPKNSLHCDTQYIGPYTDFGSAYDALCTMPVARDCECKFIQPMQPALDHDAWREASVAYGEV